MELDSTQIRALVHNTCKFAAACRIKEVRYAESVMMNFADMVLRHEVKPSTISDVQADGFTANGEWYDV